MVLKYFNLDEFRCSHTGYVEMDEGFLERLDHLRDICGFSFAITSGYRHSTHPIEAKKEKPGTHAQGIAADIMCTNGVQKRLIVEKAMMLNFGGIGVARTFIHVDTRESTPVIWSYT